eukprot:8234834-Pyramimonas_sp.AAC.1
MLRPSGVVRLDDPPPFGRNGRTTHIGHQSQKRKENIPIAGANRRKGSERYWAPSGQNGGLRGRCGGASGYFKNPTCGCGARQQCLLYTWGSGMYVRMC